MLASYLLDATRPGHPLEETSLEHLGYKALTEEDVCGRGAKALPLLADCAGGAAQLRRRTRRPGAAARRAGWRRSSSPMASSRSTASSRCRWCRSWPTWSAPASASTRAALARQSEHLERELAGYTTRDLRARRRAVQHQLAAAARARALREAAADRRQEDREDPRAVDGGRRPRGARARRTSCRGWSSSGAACTS